MKICFDKAQLPEEVIAILKTSSNVYARAAALAKFVEGVNSPAVHTLLCLVDLEMACAQSTEFEEDMIDFGSNALIWLNKASKIEPGNEEIKQSILSIQKKINKAGKSAKEILKYEKENLDEMPGMAYVQELAFYYYARRKKSLEFAGKGYKAYKYVYDKELLAGPGSPTLLYYWHALTVCKFEVEGFNGARAEIEQLINWDLQPEFLSYTGCVTDGYWLKLFHHSEMNDIEAFRKLYGEWYSRMVPLERSGKPYLAMLEMLNPISNWLLQQEDTDAYLEYILENGYLFFNKKVLEEMHLEMVRRIKDKLKHR